MIISNYSIPNMIFISLSGYDFVTKDLNIFGSLILYYFRQIKTNEYK